MKIIVVSGSPRKNGNTDLLVKAFVSGVNPSNQVEVIFVRDYHVNPCLGCNACRTNGGICFQKDDMQCLYEKLGSADVLVFASPVYFYNISSQLKAVIDRLHNPIRNTFKVKELMLLGVCADCKDFVFDSIISMYNNALKYFKLKDGGKVLVYGVESKGAIEGNAGLIEARVLGESIQ